MSFGGGTNFNSFTAKTFTLVPSAANDIILVQVICETAADFVTAISSSNVTWDGSPTVAHTTVGGTEVTVVWKGKSTSTSSATVTLTTAGSPTVRGFWTEFTTTAGYADVALDVSGTVAQTGTAPPSLTPGHGAGELYWGFQFNTGTGTAGSTSGYTYEVDASGNVAMWNTNCTSSAQSPTIGGGGDLGGAAVLLYEAVTAHTAAASLTVTPSLSAARTASHGRTASLTVTPSLSAARTASHGRTAALAVTPATANTVLLPFPAYVLGLLVEILVNGTWEDITAYVYQRSDISITRGLPDETQSATPSSMTMVLNNRDGRFSFNNAGGAYYPYLTLNTQCRVSVMSGSSTGVEYSGYRYWGQIASFAPMWDVTGNDAYVNLTVSGVLRPLVQGPVVQSPMTRALLGLSGTLECVALWPCEDGQYASQISSAAPGGGAATFVSGTPNLASDTPMIGATLPLPTLNGSQWHAVVPSYTSNGSIVVRFLVDFKDNPGTGNAWTLAQIILTGNPCNFVNLVVYDPSDYGSNDIALNLIGYAGSPATEVFNVAGSGNADINFNANAGTPNSNTAFWVSMEIQEVAGKVQFSCVLLPANATQAVTIGSGTTSVSGSVGDITDIFINPYTVAFDGTAAGMISVQSYWETMYNFRAQLVAFAGETAAARLQRLCDANGLTFTLVGSSADTPLMGPQAVDTLMNIMQACMDMDRGILYESRGTLGVEYRTRVNMQNQSAAVTASYSGSALSAPPKPALDDQYRRNYVVLTQNNGGSATYQLASGPMSVQAPPNGINPYYYPQTVFAYSDTQLPNLAQWIVMVGTVNEYRFPQIAFSLARSEAASLFADVPGTDIGDYIQVTGPPAFLQSADIKQLAWGYTETLNARKWDITFNAVPESPYEGGSLPTW